MTYLAEANRELLEEIGKEIAAVEQELARQMDSQVSLVKNVGEHTLQAGGKRLRPALVSLAARATGLSFDSQRTRKLGACMEMIHMATLIHDDVIDHASSRRGVPTASSVFGSTAAILSGDALLAKAMVILAEDGDLRIIRLVSAVVVDLAEGEVQELEARGNFELTEETHREILRRKTATFIQACCQVGGLVAGCSDDALKALADYGFHVGMAFQFADDLLDYRADSTETGKPRAGDFREGCATLPLIYLRDELTPDEREYVAQRFGNGVKETDLDSICGWMDDRGVFAKSEQAARQHATQAVDALSRLQHSQNRDLLSSVAEFVVNRKS